MQVVSQDARNMARTQERGGTFSLLSWSLLFAEPCQLAHAGTGHLLSALSKMNTPCLSARQSSTSVSPSTSNLGLLRPPREAGSGALLVPGCSGDLHSGCVFGSSQYLTSQGSRVAFLKCRYPTSYGTRNQRASLSARRRSLGKPD